MRQPRTTFSAQPGPQTQFLAASADVVLYGGAAGGGKSFGLLLDTAALATKWKGFGAVIFRRTSKQVMSEGGLWDKSEELFPFLGAKGTRNNMRWTFPKHQSTINFAHLEHEANRLDWQGSEIAYLGFDELTHFTESQFWYLFSRNRSVCGCKPMLRGTLNPDPDHFAARLVEWYIDQDTGYAIPERSGVVRYFVRIEDDVHWAAKKSELLERFGPVVAERAKSFTFISSKIEDNPILLRKNPEYLSTLMALPTVERERLRYGNWKVRPAAGAYFKREKFRIVPDYPRGYLTVRYWDRAATEPSATNPDPDWTAGVMMTRDPDGIYYIIDVAREQLNPLGVGKLITSTAALDGPDVAQVLEQDPGQAGVMEVQHLIRLLAGFNVKAVPKTVKTELLCMGFSSQQLADNVRLVRGDWNNAFINELVNFPQAAKDDQVVAGVGGFNELTLGPQAITDNNYMMGGTHETGIKRSVFRPSRMR